MKKPEQKFYSHDEYCWEIYVALDELSHSLSFYRNSNLNWHVQKYIEDNDFATLQKVFVYIEEYERELPKLQRRIENIKNAVIRFMPFQGDRIDDGDNFVFSLYSEIEAGEKEQIQMAFSYDLNNFKDSVIKAIDEFQNYYHIIWNDTPLLRKWISIALCEEHDGEYYNHIINIYEGLIPSLDGLSEVYRKVLATIQDYKPIADPVYVRKELE